MTAPWLALLVLVACHAQPTNTHGAPKEWTIAKSGERCTTVELDACAANTTCAPRDYPCPTGAVLSREGKLRADGGACLFVAGPCPPGSRGVHCDQEPENLHVPCP